MEKMGLRTERLSLEWISAAEGLRFQEVMEKMEKIRKSVTPKEIAKTMRIAKEQKTRSKSKASATAKDG
jgi:heterodisulfide reductase subunit A